MAAVTRWAPCAVAVFAFLCAACGSEVSDEVKLVTAPAACPPGQQRACACLGGTALGIQACLPSGEGFGPCEGCPSLDSGTAQTGGEPVASGGEPMVGGGLLSDTGGLPASGGTTASGGENAAATGGTSATGGGEQSGGVMTETGGSLLDIAPAEGAPGVACGVALPVLCASDAEKCCLRSLRTDSCIAASESCTCDLAGCTTTEAYCDGPEDCPDSQVCCGTAGATGYVAFRCKDTCSDPRVERVACHIGAADDMCPSGLICANSQLVSTIQICIDPATIQQ